MKRLLLLTLVIALTAVTSGCETVDAANEYFAEGERRAEEAKLVLARLNCENYGFTKGADTFAGCVQTEINQAKLRAAAAAAAAGAVGPTQAARPQSAIADSPSLFQPSPSPTTTTCRRTILGTLECTSR